MECPYSDMDLFRGIEVSVALRTISWQILLSGLFTPLGTHDSHNYGLATLDLHPSESVPTSDEGSPIISIRRTKKIFTFV
jgi:hypothetical protein